MITSTNKLKASLLSTILILFSTVTCSQEKISNSNGGTTFFCDELEQANTWGTFAKRGEYISDFPIISWQTIEFGEQWTPKKRCFHVSEKLTKAVKRNRGRLAGLTLTYGKVSNGLTVICAVNANQQDCDNQNMLFTLNQENVKNPSLVLAKINNFSEHKGGESTVYEGGEGIQFISLEDLVNSSFKW